MWLVINLNIAIDKTIKIKSFEKGSIYRFNSAITLPGGKGINVARAAKKLGLKTEIWGFISGYNGLWIKENLNKEGLKNNLINCNSGESRICYSVVDENGISTDFNEDGPYIPELYQKKFIKKLGEEIHRFDILSISGRSPLGLRSGFYSSIIKIAKSLGVRIYADLSGNSLKECIEAGAEIVKINNEEFKELFGERLSEKNLLKFFNNYKKFGLNTLIVTNGPEPFYCYDSKDIFKIYPPKLNEIKSPVGAGDSFLAALIVAFKRKYNIEKAIKFATSAAVSDCLSLGAGFISIKDINKFLNKIVVRKIK